MITKRREQKGRVKEAVKMNKKARVIRLVEFGEVKVSAEEERERKEVWQ